MRQSDSVMSFRFNYPLIAIFLFLFVIEKSFASANDVELLSPDGQIKVYINLSDKIYYTVSENNLVLLENSSLQLRLSGETLGASPKLAGKKTSAINETIQREIPLRNAQVKKQLQCTAPEF